MYKNLSILLVIIALSIGAKAQISGISGSKMAAICAGTVPNKGIEFEPAFEMNRTYGVYDSHGLSLPYDSGYVYNESGVGLRMTYGVIENLEVGVSLPIDASEFGFGAKYQLPFGESSKFGLLAGYDFDASGLVYKSSGNLSTRRVGLAYSQSFGEKLSTDIDFIYSKIGKYRLLNEEKYINSSADIGWFVTDGLQLVASASYENEMQQSFQNNQIIKLTPGFTVERGESFILVVGAPFTVWGAGWQTKTIGFFTALTIMLD